MAKRACCTHDARQSGGMVRIIRTLAFEVLCRVKIRDTSVCVKTGQGLDMLGIVGGKRFATNPPMDFLEPMERAMAKVASGGNASANRMREFSRL